MTYRLAKSLEELRAALNRAAPFRSRESDGWIGDAAHAARTSDHNPWVKDGKTGVVTALDVTNDPAHGVDGNVLAAALISDPRVKYVIWDRKIWSRTKPSWRAYSGKNPHTKHVHTSVLSSKANYDDTKPWNLGIEAAAAAAAHLPPAATTRQKLRLGDQGGDVFLLQRLLEITEDGDFGPITEKAVRDLQQRAGLPVDGIVGPYTWDKLEAIEAQATKPETHEPLPLVSETPVAVLPYGTPAWTVAFLEGRGWPKAAAIALTSNLVWESGGEHRDGYPLAIVWNAHGDNNHSHSAVQWNEKHGRWQDYMAHAYAEGRPVYDPAMILTHLDKELRTTEKAAGSVLKDATDVRQATVDAAMKFWRPGTPHAERRVAIAERLAKETGYVEIADPVDPVA